MSIRKPHFVVFGDLDGVHLDEDWRLVGKSETGISLTSKGVTRSLDVGGVKTGPLSRLEEGEELGVRCLTETLGSGKIARMHEDKLP